MRTDLLVVGAGPAGMAAALAAADHGVDVSVVDSYPDIGGQYFRRGPGATYLPRRLARIGTHPRIALRCGTSVWLAHRDSDGDFHCGLSGADRITAQRIVLATGATELALPFPGWDLPGVITAGAAQALLKGHGVAVGRRIVVAGTGPFLLPVAAALRHRVVAVLDANRPITPGIVRYPGRIGIAAGYLARLAGRMRFRQAVIECRGDDRVRVARVAKVDPDWRPIPGTVREIAVDSVCVSYGFVPVLDLARSLGCRISAGHVWHDDAGRTSVPGVFVAGEATGIGGWQRAEAEGRRAGLAAAGVAPPALRPDHFADLLARLYPVRPGWIDWQRGDTIICRCEEVPYSTVEDAIGRGLHTARAVRAGTRCGMGYCQGRVCGPILQQLLPGDGDGLHGRPILQPTALADVAGLNRSDQAAGRS